MNQLPLLDLPSDRSPREKNLIALIIILCGLILGSLFVDVLQLVMRSGFSDLAVRGHNLLESGDKTWVAYDDPKVTLRVVTDDSCDECTPDEALLWLRRIVPTVLAHKVDSDSDEGRELIERYSLRTLPSFIFERTIEETGFFTEAAPLFLEKEEGYVFDMNKIGLPVGKYLVAPTVSDTDIRLGGAEAPLTVTIFSDFQCQYCRLYHETMKKLITTYGERVRFVFKHFPLPSHPQAENAALASECAQQQGKFLEMSDLLFARQNEWGNENGVQSFKNYAWRVQGLDARAFAQCLDQGTPLEKVLADIQTAQDFSLVSAPSTFVGTEFVEGAATEADLSIIIDRALEQQ